MNRDELKERVAAMPPSLHQIGCEALIYPQEPSGGTWIAATCRGDSFALMNANLPHGETLGPKRASRGLIIPYLFLENTVKGVDHRLGEIQLTDMFPFRLFGIFRGTCAIAQWYWDGARVISRRHEWIRNHWFSSSRSDARAEVERGKVCEMSWREDTQDSVEWLRALHSSHIPEAGAFSVCVHRLDAATVSYTEVQCGPRELRMSYLAGNPCAFTGSLSTVTMPLNS